MTIQILDLKNERCPMALLLAKRAACQLSVHQRLDIHLTDTASLQDITRYLTQHHYSVSMECESESVMRLRVIREE
ncbi:sulfurtransferase TusA family protein [Thaumasiovibrio subtropicus]|uniref:sulfurtransferase TusA family protein n=1 Tax=Thaumasiovibrio subtropicus TaxID=1891207 RepID=UPI000B34E45E|nr:sulfurtransferase TusA family protein [Thaumasiovibrio subtropicus]